MQPMHRPDLITRIIDGEVVILDRVAEKVHQLNPTASCIWDSCDGTLTAAEIAARVAQRFDVPANQAQDDVVATLADFERLGLLLVK